MILPDAAPVRPLRRGARALLAAAVYLAAASAASCSPRGPAPVTPARPAAPVAPAARGRLEVFRVDDLRDPFARVREGDLPAGEGIAILSERVSVGHGPAVRSHFARIVLRPGEAPADARARLRRWLDAIPLRPGAHFGFAPVVDDDPAASRAAPAGLRTLVVSGDAVLTQDDVVGATVTEPDGDAPARVAVVLSPEGAGRLATVTREWADRRLAVVIDDLVVSAPVVRAPIDGGRLEISLGPGRREATLAEARAIARAFTRPSP